jgi:1,2-diacylglycerol 3-beta-glucosyltransferase
MTLRPIGVVLAAAGVVPAAAGTYLAGLAVLGRAGTPPVGDTSRTIAVIVPAHNEAANIAETIASIHATEYPVERRRIMVIADNCTDATAALARAAGAEVIERFDAVNRGKGYALGDVFPQVLADPRVDAVVVVDADTIVSTNLLLAFGARFAAGEDAVQARYGVRNAEASWRTRLLKIAFAAFHDVRSLGRERIRVSTGLRGNGMAFSRRALTLVPHDAFSVVEDLEYGLRLAAAGIRVAYAHEAEVVGEMPSDGKSAASQRQRWERGRAQMRREHGFALVRKAVTKRDAVAADLAADVLVPPLGQLGVVLGAGTAIAVAWRVATSSSLPLRVWGFGLSGLIAHVGAGWWRSGTGARGLVDLAAAPAYVGWKLGSKAVRKAPDTWVRTTREAERSPTTESSTTESTTTSTMPDTSASRHILSSSKAV